MERHPNTKIGQEKYWKTYYESYDQKADERFAASWKLGENGCHEWQRPPRGGYGSFTYRGKERFAHRWLYERVNGPVPEGLQLDHLCKNTICVNIDHLEVVTQKENMRRSDWMSGVNYRKTHCIHGHEFSGYNLIVKTDSKGRKGRRCRTCKNEAHKLRMRRIRASQ